MRRDGKRRREDLSGLKGSQRRDHVGCQAHLRHLRTCRFERHRAMGKGRLEAFTDGVMAIIITIMVLEIKVPSGTDLAAFSSSLPILHAATHVDGKVLWANLFLLFWLSLIPFVIRWIDESHFEALPIAGYGVVHPTSGGHV